MLEYSCIKYAIINVIWATLNVITCDTTSTRWAVELKGDFDESYLAKQSHVCMKRKMGWIKQVSKKFDLLVLFLLKFISKERLFVRDLVAMWSWILT